MLLKTIIFHIYIYIYLEIFVENFNACNFSLFKILIYKFYSTGLRSIKATQWKDDFLYSVGFTSLSQTGWNSTIKNSNHYISAVIVLKIIIQLFMQ